MYNYPKLSSLLIILISIIIIIGCAFHKSLKEGLTNINNVILLGDSVLNNSNYVPSGKSVGDILNSKLSNVLNLAKDGATINDLYRQLDDIPIELDKAETFVFISAGGNDILNKRMELNPVDIKNLFDSYMNFLRALRVKLVSAKINVLNLYLPANPRYASYKSSITQWNNLINQYSSKIGEMYNVIDIYSLLTTPNDFVYDIEPSETGSEKIAKIIYLTR
jgi:lysophospholipase L1-like esterase